MLDPQSFHDAVCDFEQEITRERGLEITRSRATKEDIEDAASEAALAALARGCAAFEDYVKVRSYMQGYAAGVVANQQRHLRVVQRHQEYVRDVPPEPEINAEQAALLRQALAQVEEVMGEIEERLRPVEREALRAAIQEGVPVAQAVREAGQPGDLEQEAFRRSCRQVERYAKRLRETLSEP